SAFRFSGWLSVRMAMESTISDKTSGFSMAATSGKKKKPSGSWAQDSKCGLAPKQCSIKKATSPKPTGFRARGRWPLWLALFDLEVLGVCPVLERDRLGLHVLERGRVHGLVPHMDCKFRPRRRVLDLVVAVLIGDGVVRMIEYGDLGGHPFVDIAVHV